MRDTSIVYPVRSDGAVLMGRKKRGLGRGKWNGFGGKLEAGETMRECAARELREECGLVVRSEDLIEVANLYFHQPSDPSWSHAGIVYLAKSWTGAPRESEEMEPRWVAQADIPYNHMWQADRRWLPLVLAGQQVRGTIYFAEDGDTVFDCQLEVLP